MSRIHVRPFPVLFAAFLIIPIIEIYLLIQVGSLIGALPTIGLVVLTAVLGVALLRAQGLQTYLRFQRSLSEGRYPATEILEGVALLLGGALLLTPGFFTDFVGFVCLVPLTRRALISWSMARYVRIYPNTLHSGPGSIYEGEATHRDD